MLEKAVVMRRNVKCPKDNAHQGRTIPRKLFCVLKKFSE